MYYTAKTLPVDSVFQVDTAAIHSLAFEARASMNSNNDCRGLSPRWWGLFWGNNPHEGYFFKYQCGNTDMDDIMDERYARLSVMKIMNGKEHEIYSKQFTRGLDLYSKSNTLALELDRNTAEMRILAGDRELNLIEILPLDLPMPSMLAVRSNTKVDIDLVVVEPEADKTKAIATEWTQQRLDEYFSRSSDSIEGYWDYLDRETDDDYARLGGKYQVALVKEKDGYSIIYVSGARVNGVNWKTGMLKGRLTVTSFIDHYNLLWHDSMMMPMDDETNASIENGSILTLNFPLHRSRLRFYRQQHASH